MSETLNLLFQSRGDGTFKLQVREGWSGRTVNSSFVPPYTHRQLIALRKRLNNVERSEEELRAIGQSLFLALCGRPLRHTFPAPTEGVPVATTASTNWRDPSEQSVQALLRGVIQRTL